MKCPYSNQGICSLYIADKCFYNNSFDNNKCCRIPNDLGIILSAIKENKNKGDKK